MKPSVTEDQKWVTAADMCAAVSWAAGWMKPVCDQLLPQLVTMEHLCATLPPVPPSIDLAALAASGLLYTVPQSVLDWILASWKNQQWNTFCECLGTAGTRPCTNIPLFHAVKPANFTEGLVLATRVACPSAFDLTLVYRYRLADGVPGNAYVAYQFEDEFFAPIYYTAADTSVTLAQGTNIYHLVTDLGGTANKARVRYIACYVRATGLGGQDTTTRYPFDVGLHVEFTGNCTYTGSEAEPPTPAPEPPVPDAPPLPPGPTGCTTDDLCRRLDILVHAVVDIGLTVEILQQGGSTPGPLTVLQADDVAGEGQIDLAPGSREVHIALATLGPGVTIDETGVPNRIRAAGVIRFGNDFGWYARQQLDSGEFMAAVPPDSTVVSWSLSNGTTGQLHHLG